MFYVCCNKSFEGKSSFGFVHESQFMNAIAFVHLNRKLIFEYMTCFNSFAPAKIAKKNVRKVAVRKTVIINHNYVPQVCL